MPDNLTRQYIKHIDSIIAMYTEAYEENSTLSYGVAFGIITRSKVAVEKITGTNSHYTKDVIAIADEGSHVSFKAELIVGILEALKGDLENNYLENLSELVRGEIFNNYLEMAEHLFDEGYKDAAAVIAGSTLEAHLRRLCMKHSIDTNMVTSNGKTQPKKSAQLNQDLGKVAYSTFDQKQINVWQDLRNNAAHGNYDSYSNTQVEQFIAWLSDFIAKNPA